jgi:hypothetical protein
MTTNPRADENDKGKWRALYAKLTTAYQKEGTYPLITLEEFFEGNRDEGSIGCNLWTHPGIDTFYRILREVRAREDVQDVLVGITDLNEFATPEETDQMAEWPFSDVLYIVTSAPVAVVEPLLAALEPDEVFPQEETPYERDFPALKEGYQVLVAWWD